MVRFDINIARLKITVPTKKVRKNFPCVSRGVSNIAPKLFNNESSEGFSDKIKEDFADQYTYENFRRRAILIRPNSAEIRLSCHHL